MVQSRLPHTGSNLLVLPSLMGRLLVPFHLDREPSKGVPRRVVVTETGTRTRTTVTMRILPRVVAIKQGPAILLARRKRLRLLYELVRLLRLPPSQPPAHQIRDLRKAKKGRGRSQVGSGPDERLCISDDLCILYIYIVSRLSLRKASIWKLVFPRGWDRSGRTLNERPCSSIICSLY